MLFLTLAVLLAMTGAASIAHGLGVEEAGHHAVEGHGDPHAHAADVEECCDAIGAAGGGCLIDAAQASGSAHPLATGSRVRRVSAAPIDPDGRTAAVPTGPPKV